jgi:hypothetical protein
LSRLLPGTLEIRWVTERADTGTRPSRQAR